MLQAPQVPQVPNLDAASEEELLKCAGKFANVSTQFASLARYCLLRAEAIKARISGQVSKAMKTEKEMDKIYQSLPSELRW